MIRHGLPLDNLRGQFYDGATNMAGDHKGVQSRIYVYWRCSQKHYYVHCFAHSLNLSVQKSIRSVHIFTDALQHIDDLAIVTKQDRLNHLSVLHVHQDRLDAVNLNKFKVDFASANEYRRTVFGHK